MQIATLEELLRLIQDEIYQRPMQAADSRPVEEGRFFYSAFLDDCVPAAPRKSTEDHILIDSLERELAKVKKRVKAIFNARFGSVFRTAHTPTLFASLLYVDLH